MDAALPRNANLGVAAGLEENIANTVPKINYLRPLEGKLFKNGKSL